MSEHAILTMGSNDVDELRGWLDEQKKSKPKKLVLRARQDTGVEQIVRELPYDPDDKKTSSDEIAQSFIGRARSAARVQTGRTSFVVNAYNERNESLDMFAFVITTEPPVRRDESAQVQLTALLMRHTEASARLALGHTLGIVDKYRELLEAREAQIASLEHRIVQMTEANERVMSIRFERELTMLQASDDLETKRYAREKFDLLLPVVMSKIAPGALAPVKGGFLAEEMVEKIMSSLSSDQTQRIMAILDPEQQIALATIAQAYNQRGADKQAKREAAAKAEADARKAAADAAA